MLALPSQSSEEVVANGSLQNNSILLTNRKPSTSSANSVSDGKDRESKRSSRSREVPDDFEFLEQSASRHDACDNDSDLDDEGNDFDGGSDVRADSNHIGIIKNTVKSNIQKQVASAPVLTSSSSGIKKNKAVNIAGACAANREQQTSRYVLFMEVQNLYHLTAVVFQILTILNLFTLTFKIICVSTIFVLNPSILIIFKFCAVLSLLISES